MTPEKQLAAGVEVLGLLLPPGAEVLLLRYLSLMQKWNRVFNLTAIRDPESMVTHHLLDSLAVLPHLPLHASVADVGSGAGLPGLPLAIARPQDSVLLVEAVGKKASFLDQARIELGLSKVSVHCGRAEELAPMPGYQVVISRAFSELRRFIEVAQGLVAPGGRLYAMKGLRPDDELAALPDGWRLADAPRLHVPGLSGQRHLIILERH